MSRFIMFLLVILVVLSIAAYLTYSYLNNRAQEKAKRRENRREFDEKMVGVAEEEYGQSDDRETERLR